jgi:TetR/AcrR family transcriptional regulator, transcriptional repressor for nem operon
VTRTGRPRAFDAHHALTQARDLFWTRGFANTSIQDLVDELNVERGSLYAAFGDKRSLYLQAVDLYAQEMRERLERALATGPVLPTLRRMLLDPATLTGADPQEDGHRRGCLLGNTAAQLQPGDVSTATLVGAAYDAVLDVLTRALTRAQETGEVSTATSPAAQAQLALLLFQGSALIGRAQLDSSRYAAGIDAALTALQASDPTRPPAAPLAAH